MAARRCPLPANSAVFLNPSQAAPTTTDEVSVTTLWQRVAQEGLWYFLPAVPPINLKFFYI